MTYYVVVNENGTIVRRPAPPPKLVVKTCPYCWAEHEATKRGSRFCTPEHAQRFRAHNRWVTATRERSVA